MRTQPLKLGITLCLLLWTTSWLWAEPAQVQHVKAELISEVKSIEPGKAFDVGLKLQMDEHWHTYWKDPGDSGLATTIKWDLPEGLKAEEIRWPHPKKIEAGGLVSYGYEGEVILLTKILPSKDLKIGRKLELKAQTEWLECSDICLPGKADLKLILDVGETQMWSEWKDRFEEVRQTIPQESVGLNPVNRSIGWYVLFAFLGGMILNLMPCVFPVLSIKVLGFVRQAGENRKALKMHGYFFALGVLVSFWVLAGLLLLLRKGGQELGWGFQLQSPAFVMFIALLLFGFGLNLLGVFEIGTSMTAFGGKVKKEGLGGAFFSGVLATLVATPCTAPFMGVAVAFALTQSVWVSWVVFTSLGLGLAFPYVLLSSIPALLKFVPKPGMWMESFKQAMAFPLMGAVVWLIWVLARQTGSGGVLFGLSALLCLSIGVWVYGRWCVLSRSQKVRMTAFIVALIFVLGAVGLSLKIKQFQSSDKFSSKESEKSFGMEWEKFSPERLEVLRNEGKRVFVDFTASWCLTCQVNKAVVFSSDEVKKKFKELDIVLLKADWTNRDPVITKALNGYGRSGVPLYILYGKGLDTEPILLPEVLTPGIVLQVLEKLE